MFPLSSGWSSFSPHITHNFCKLIPKCISLLFNMVRIKLSVAIILAAAAAAVAPVVAQPSAPGGSNNPPASATGTQHTHTNTAPLVTHHFIPYAAHNEVHLHGYPHPNDPHLLISPQRISPDRQLVNIYDNEAFRRPGSHTHVHLSGPVIGPSGPIVGIHTLRGSHLHYHFHVHGTPRNPDSYAYAYSRQVQGSPVGSHYHIHWHI